MKKLLCAVSAILLSISLAACTTPDSVQMDLYQGYGRQLKLIHLNASTGDKQERMLAFAEALTGAQQLEKSFDTFAYYPDYILEIKGLSLTKNGDSYTVDEAADGTITAVIDINGDYVDFYFPGPEPEEANVIYRAAISARDFKKLVHQVS